MAAEQALTYVSQALLLVNKTLQGRGTVYAVHGEFENFEEQARVAGVTLRQVFRGAIGQKLTRENAMATTGQVKDEHYFDSILDTAGYAILWLAYELSQNG